MDFAAIVAFTIVLYVRPHEILTFLADLRPAFVVMAWAGASLFMRPQGLNWKSIVRTPHDWVMLTYFLWIIFTNDDEWGTWLKIYPFVGFYFITVQALTNMTRIYLFLYWWLGCIMFIATMALLSLVGIDPAGSQYVTDGSGGRLVFNTTLFNNANALGHSVIVAVPMVYFLMFWRRPVFIKEVGLALLPISLYCTYRTESKGAFIAGFGAILAALVFGRPKAAQIIILTVALTAGTSAMTLLPRWGELQTASKDEAIQGRVDAFKFGRWATETHDYGVGYGNFVPAFLNKEGEEVARASHSSYNQVSGELGMGGLLLFVGLMYTCARTLVQAKTSNDFEERVRRTLFCLVVTYAVSSWMIDFAFRAAFFVMIAMVGAFHRRLQAHLPPTGTDEHLAAAQETKINPVMGMGGANLAAAGGTGTSASSHVYLMHMKQVRSTVRQGATTSQSAVAPIAPLSGSSTTQVSNAYAPAVADATTETIAGTGSMPWIKIGILDCIIMWYLMKLTLYIRTYAIEDLFAA
ncbi:MAG: hypothetical protein ACKVHO_00195 [Verrucomicrobiia bacterium]|jgi:hypothetical protein